MGIEGECLHLDVSEIDSTAQHGGKAKLRQEGRRHGVVEYLLVVQQNVHLLPGMEQVERGPSIHLDSKTVGVTRESRGLEVAEGDFGEYVGVAMGVLDEPHLLLSIGLL